MTESTTQAAAVAVAKQPRKKRNLILWIAGPALVIIIGAYFYVTSGRYVSTDNAYVQADQVNVASQVPGRVVEVLVHENQAVKKGDILFKIDAQPLEIAVARNEAQLDSMHSLLDAARAGFHSAQATVKSADEALRVNEAQYKRMQELRARGLVAEKDVDDAANNYANARGTRDSDVAAVAKAEGLLGGLPTTPDEKLAAYKLAEVTLAQAKLDLEHATVRAPMDGTIGKQNLQPGDFLAVGQAAMPLIATQSMWVNANFKETELTNVVIDQPAMVEVDTYPGKKWKAHVSSISPASGAEFSILPPQNATGNWVKIVQRIPVRVSIDDQSSGPILRAGMSAVVEIDTGRQNSIIGRIEGNDDSKPTRVAETLK
jgi:membrane fusion protein (multidrug efflux system)